MIVNPSSNKEANMILFLAMLVAIVNVESLLIQPIKNRPTEFSQHGGE